MHINLVERDAKKHTKRKRRRILRRRKRSRTFETAIAQPQIRKRRRTKPRPTRPRAERKAKAERRRVRWTISWRVLLVRLPTALVLLGLIALLAYVSTDAKFFVYEAQIVGAHHLKAKAIYETAGVHEQSIFWIEPQQVAERIARLHGVKTVRVQTALPARVFIEVEERDPAVMWRALSQEKDFWLDAEGVVLPYHGDIDDTIFVVDSSQRTLSVGDRIEPRDIVASVQQLAAGLPGINLFFYDAERGLSFRQDFGELSRAEAGDRQWPVYVGTSEDLPRKIQATQTLTDYFSVKGIKPTYVDVRWADHPVYHVPPGEATGGGD